MADLRVAVIGLGSFGKNHVRAIAETPGVQLAGVFDLDPSKSSFSSIEEIFGQADCAIVATPTATHEEIASPLLRGGLDVLVEKPIASSSEAGRRLSNLALQQGRILQVGHLKRFNPSDHRSPKLPHAADFL